MEWHGLCKYHFEKFLDKERDLWCEEDDLGTCDFVGCDKKAEYELYPNLKEKIKDMNKEDFGINE